MATKNNYVAFNTDYDIKCLFKLAEHFTDSMVIKFDTNGMSFQIMDVSHTCLLAGNIKSDKFKTYEIIKESELAIFISAFIKTFSISGPKPQVSWEWDNNTDIVHLKVIPENETKYQSFFGEAKLLDFDMEDKRLTLPETNWVTYQVNTESLKKALNCIRRLDANCRSVYIHPDNNKIKVMADTEHIKNATIYVDIEEDTNEKNNEKEKNDDDEEGFWSEEDLDPFTNMSYQITLLTKVFDTISNISDSINISWAEGRPLFIECSDFQIYFSPIIEETFD